MGDVELNIESRSESENIIINTAPSQDVVLTVCFVFQAVAIGWMIIGKALEVLGRI